MARSLIGSVSCRSWAPQFYSQRSSREVSSGLLFALRPGPAGKSWFLVSLRTTDDRATTDFASRLESLNKYLGTQALISEAVRRQLGDQFTTRRLGEFRVAGKTHSVVIHELFCRCTAENGEGVWIKVFEAGLDNFRMGKFASAAELMTRTCELRGGSDGPAEFYLRKVATLSDEAKRENWNGIIELSEK